MAASLRCRKILKRASRKAAYSANASRTTTPSWTLYANINASINTDMRPSIRPVISPSASMLRIGSIEPKRDTMSPMCRFSKKESGKRTR